MKFWTLLICEAYCSVDGDTCPCGREAPSSFCLGDGQDRRCPYFSWVESDAREAASFVPIYVIVWDRIKRGFLDVVDTCSWWLWYKWMNHVMSIPVVKCTDPYAIKYRAEQAKLKKCFASWFSKAKKVSNANI